MGFALYGFLNLLNLQFYDLTEFFGRGIALVLLQELVRGSLDLVADGYLALRSANRVAIICYGLQDALANPPDGIRDKLKTTRIIKPVGSSDKAYISLVNEIGKGQALMLVLFSNRYHKTEIGCDQFLSGFVSFLASSAYGLRQFDFLLSRDHGYATNLDKVFVE
jgi:hypothetical protein